MEMDELSVEVRERGDTVVVDLQGDLDGRADATMSSIYAQAAATAPRAIVLNFAEVGYINSTGIALIVGVLAQARGASIDVHAIGLSEHYRHIFEITRLADFVRLFASEDEAIGDGMAAST
jgi:anti-sigma B factor antagonist